MSARRLDIQGLRAIAVLLVVLFHAGLPVLPGGLVGVDVFYVISGFLIVGLIADEVAKRGRIDLLGFWSRRVRRLLPASLLVLVVTVVASRLLLPPLFLPDIARDALSAALYLSNVRFALEGVDYTSGSDPSPLLHYWSLSLEEQFYLLLPIAVLLIARFTKRPVRNLAILLGLGGLASFIVCVALTATWQPLAFFLLPTRAWQLALGGLTAILLRRMASRRHATAPDARVLAALGVFGLLAIAYAGVALSDNVPLPGWRAAVPTVGAAALLFAGSFQTGPVQRLLSVRPLTYVGDISYSLYLWHWPFMVIPALALERELSGLERTGLVLAAGLASVASYHLVEDPVRRARGLARRRLVTFAGAGAVTALVVVVALAAGQLPRLDSGRPAAQPGGGRAVGAEGAAYVPSDVEPTLRDAFYDASQANKDGCLIPFPKTAPRACSYGPDAKRTVVLFGDSHAEPWAAPLTDLAESHGFRLVTLLKSACPVVQAEVWQRVLNRSFSECGSWRKASLAQIAKLRPALVVAASNHTIELVGDDSDQTWADGIGGTVAEIVQTGTPVVWLSHVPSFEHDVPTCLSAHLDDAEACTQSRRTARDDAYDVLERKAVTAAGGRWLDIGRWVCPDERCAVISGRYLMFRDRNHLTASYARTLAPLLWSGLRIGQRSALVSGPSS